MKQLKHLMVLACCCVTIYSYGRQAPADSASCSSGCCCEESSQTPVGIMTDHVHGKGQWMASYMYMDMIMDGNRVGADKATSDVAYVKYMMAPEKMAMQMHMAMLMYGLTNRITLMAMGGYAITSMSMGMTPGSTHSHMLAMGSGSMITSGFTDTRISALYSLLNRPAHRIILTGGISIPSGSINKTSDMYGSSQVAPYCMQQGSGTFGLLPSVTYVTTTGNLSLGTQAAADIKLGRNARDYKFGDIYSLNIWGAYRVFSFMSVSLRAEGLAIGSIKGYDPDVAVYMYNDPTADAANYGSKKVNVYAGLNFSFKKPSGLHLLVEYGMPAYQYVNGLQMSAQANLLAGVQYTF